MTISARSMTSEFPTNEAQGDIAAVILCLESALTLAEPEGHVRIFAECAPPMARLLREAITRGLPPPTPLGS